MNLGLENTNRWLLDSQVGHLYVEAVEVDALEALSDGLGETRLTDLVKHLEIGDGASLVELAVQAVVVDNAASVDHELVPVGALCKQWHFFGLLEHVLKVPGELKHIRVLVLVERLVSANSLIQCFDTRLISLVLGLSRSDGIRREESDCGERSHSTHGL